MIYMKTLWIHNYDNEPIILYSELDNERYEVRQIWVYDDQSYEIASEEYDTDESFLSPVPYPSIDEIRNANTEDDVFEPELITKEDFEIVWKNALRYLEK